MISDSNDRTPPRDRRSRRSHSRSPPRSRRRSPAHHGRSSDRGGSRSSRDRDHAKSGGHASRPNLGLSSTSLGAELLKHKKAKNLLLEKKQKEAAAVANATAASMVVNTELQDPRSQPPVHSSSRHHQPSTMPPQHNLGGRDGSTASSLLQSNGQASVTNPSVVPRRGQRAPPHRPAALPMPPGHGMGLEMGRSHMASDGSSPIGMGGVRGRSIISSLPLPSISEDEDSQGKGKRKRKPKVIGKPMPTKMCEDGSEWGERCIEIYEIVDKVGEGMC